MTIKQLEMEMDKRLESIEKGMGLMSSQVKEVYDALMGNKVAGEAGLTERIKMLETQSAAHEKFQNVILTSWKFLGIIGAIVMALAGFLIGYYKR